MTNEEKKQLARIAFAGVVLHAGLSGLVAQHPKDTDSSLVVAMEDIQELIDQFHATAYEYGGRKH